MEINKSHACIYTFTCFKNCFVVSLLTSLLNYRPGHTVLPGKDHTARNSSVSRLSVPVLYVDCSKCI